MCLIVATNKDVPMTEEFVEDVISKNRDGFGLMWIQDNKVKIHKSATDTFDEVWRKYNEVKEFNPLVHFRMKTHGYIDEHNAHPYYCGHGIWLMHNGILHTGNKRDETKSDTWHFINDVLKPLLDSVKNPHEFIKTNCFLDLIEEYIGHNNKMVFASKQGFIFTRPEAWYKIQNTWTHMVGVVVSNQYAWNERSFVDPTVPVLSKRERKRLAREQAKQRPLTGVNSKVNTYQPTQTNGAYGKPEEYFRRNSFGLEEFDDVHWIDNRNQVWIKTAFGWRRDHLTTFSSLCEQKYHQAQQWAEQEAKKQLLLQIPALVLSPIKYPTNTEVEEMIDRIAYNNSGAPTNANF